MSDLLSLLVYRVRISVLIKESIILLNVKELEKNPSIQIHLKGSNLSGKQVQRTMIFCLADMCPMFLRSYDIKKKYTPTKYSRRCLPLRLKWTWRTSIARNTERKKVSVPYNLHWLRIFLVVVTLWIWHLDKKLYSEARGSRKLWLTALFPKQWEGAHCLPSHNTEGFLVQVHITLSSHTLLPGSQLASPYGQLFLDIAAHSEQDTLKSIIMPTEPNLHIQDHLQYESRYPGLLHSTSFLVKWRKWDRPSSQTVLLLCCQEERQWVMTWVPHHDTVKRFL